MEENRRHGMMNSCQGSRRSWSTMKRTNRLTVQYGMYMGEQRKKAEIIESCVRETMQFVIAECIKQLQHNDVLDLPLLEKNILHMYALEPIEEKKSDIPAEPFPLK